MKQALQLYWRYSRLAWPYWDKIFVSLVITTCTQAVILLPPLFLKGLFDYAYPYKDIRLLLWFSILPFALSFLFNALNSLRGFLDLYVYQKVMAHLNYIFYLKVQRLPLSFFHLHRVGDLLFRATSDLQNITHAVLNLSPNLISTGIKLVLMIGLCLIINPALTGLALLGIPFQFLETHYFAKKIKNKQQVCEEMSASHYNFLEERFNHIKLIKLLQHWAQELQALKKSLDPIFRAEIALAVVTALRNISASTLMQFWTIVLGIYTGYCIISGTMSLGDVVAITAYLLMLRQPFQTLANLYQQLSIAQISFSRLAMVLSHPEESHHQLENKKIPLVGDIRFDAVAFGYNTEHLILQSISFHIRAGETVAIVGRSGIGKSSIADLLLGFYVPTQGKIYFDNTPSTHINLRYLRTQIGLVSQNTPLLFGSIRDNILFGSYAQDVSQAHLEKCAKMADAHEFIQAFPNGYDTQTGPNGVTLSSGQRQRIAIARALLSNPTILIFDEATSGLDSDSEKQIYNTLEKFRGNKTIILIAHRLSSLKLANQIVVLGENGQIAEQGTVPELMSRGGVFYQLYESQLGGFQYLLQHLQLLLRSVKRYKRPLCVACIYIKNYHALRHTLPEDLLDRRIQDVLLHIRHFIREVDYATYQSEGCFWVLLPETDGEGAHTACQRIIGALTVSDATKEEGVVLAYSVHACTGDDQVDSIVSILSKDSHAVF